MSARRRPGLAEVAARCGVSVATVSNVYSGKGRVSGDLADRVRRVGAQIGYRPNAAGQALRTGQSRLLGLVLPDIAYPLFPRMAQAFQRVAAARGFGVLIADAAGRGGQTGAIAQLEDRGVDGLIVIPRRGTRVIAANAPVAVIDTDATPGNAVASDHREGGRMVGRRLLELGHRDVLVLAGDPASMVQTERAGGMEEALRGRARIRRCAFARADQAARIADAALTACRDGATAVAAVGDLPALTAMTALQRGGFAAPADVSVIGFDDLDWAAAITPSLSSVRQDVDRLAETALTNLSARIAAPDADPPRLPPIPVTLLERESSGPAPNRQGDPR